MKVFVKKVVGFFGEKKSVSSVLEMDMSLQVSFFHEITVTT